MKKIGFTSALRLLPATLLIIASFSVYWTALGHEFLTNWDDHAYVTQNPLILGLSVTNIRTAFAAPYLGNYAPIHLLSYMLDYELWGLRALGFILTNIAVHTANGLLVYGLLRHFSRDTVWPFVAALIFLLHPVQVESVAWVSERKNVLAMLFFLAGFSCYIAYREAVGRRRMTFYSLALILCVCSLLSKSVAVIFPLVILLFDVCYRGERNLRTLIMDKIPFLFAALLIAIITLVSQQPEFEGGRTSHLSGSPLVTLLTMLPVLVRYLRMVFWPANLSNWYNPPIKTSLDSDVILATCICVGLIIWGALMYFRDRRLFFWYAVFFIGLLPVSQIIPIVTLMNDRYLYFPMLGGAPFLSALVFREIRWQDVTSSMRAISISGAALLSLVLLATVTIQRVKVWENSYTLWSDTLLKSPGLALPHDCLGGALQAMGELDRAIEQFRIAISLEPPVGTPQGTGNHGYDFAKTHNNLGVAYGKKGMTSAAIQQFELAIKLKPSYAKAYDNLGAAYMNAGRVHDAIRQFEKAAQLNPRLPEVHNHLRKAREIQRSSSGAFMGKTASD